MFDLSDEIVFLDPFFAVDTEYEISEEKDTVAVLVKTQPSRIRIKYGGEDFIVDITGQIFAMKRENAFWKIWKWIELN
jgi:spore maturation protein CgeB